MVRARQDGYVEENLEVVGAVGERMMLPTRYTDLLYLTSTTEFPFDFLLKQNTTPCFQEF